MSRNLTNSLDSTRELLAGSLKMRADEKSPALPADLLEDISKHFAKEHAPVSPKSRSWFAAVQSFIARPAFGLGALAMVILGLGLPAVMGPGKSETGFRGAASRPTQSESARIVLINAPSDVAQALASSGDFEAGMITSGDSITDAAPGARVVVNFPESNIVVFDAQGEEIHRSTVPKDTTELSAAIATALSHL
jgi:hypothetical protein